MRKRCLMSVIMAQEDSREKLSPVARCQNFSKTCAVTEKLAKSKSIEISKITICCNPEVAKKLHSQITVHVTLTSFS